MKLDPGELVGQVIEVTRNNLNLWRKETYDTWTGYTWPGPVPTGSTTVPSLPPVTKRTDRIMPLPPGTRLKVEEVLFDARSARGRKGRHQALYVSEERTNIRGFVWSVYANTEYVARPFSPLLVAAGGISAFEIAYSSGRLASPGHAFAVCNVSTMSNSFKKLTEVDHRYVWPSWWKDVTTSPYEESPIAMSAEGTYGEATAGLVVPGAWVDFHSPELASTSSHPWVILFPEGESLYSWERKCRETADHVCRGIRTALRPGLYVIGLEKPLLPPFTISVHERTPRNKGDDDAVAVRVGFRRFERCFWYSNVIVTKNPREYGTTGWWTVTVSGPELPVHWIGLQRANPLVGCPDDFEVRCRTAASVQQEPPRVVMLLDVSGSVVLDSARKSKLIKTTRSLFKALGDQIGKYDPIVRLFGGGLAGEGEAVLPGEQYPEGDLPVPTFVGETVAAHPGETISQFEERVIKRLTEHSSEGYSPVWRTFVKSARSDFKGGRSNFMFIISDGYDTAGDFHVFKASFHEQITRRGAYQSLADRPNLLTEKREANTKIAERIAVQAEEALRVSPYWKTSDTAIDDCLHDTLIRLRNSEVRVEFALVREVLDKEEPVYKLLRTMEMFVVETSLDGTVGDVSAVLGASIRPRGCQSEEYHRKIEPGTRKHP